MNDHEAYNRYQITVKLWADFETVLFELNLSQEGKGKQIRYHFCCIMNEKKRTYKLRSLIKYLIYAAFAYEIKPYQHPVLIERVTVWVISMVSTKRSNCNSADQLVRNRFLKLDMKIGLENMFSKFFFEIFFWNLFWN